MDGDAVIVVDMVKGFCRPQTDDGPCELYVKGSEEIVPRIQELIKKVSGTVIFTCDAHQEDDREFDKHPPHCIKGTQESEIIEELLEGIPEHIRVDKASYNSFHQTELDEVLKENGIKRLYICGLLTDICVFATAMTAVVKGYETIVPHDCVTSLDPQKHRAALDIMYGSMNVKDEVTVSDWD